MRRVIYALEIFTTPDLLSSRIFWLDESGNAKNIRPLSKPRVIDLRVGDQFWLKGETYTVHQIEAYREARIPDDFVPLGGYIVKE
jgi:hypothetical protein